MEEQQEYSFIQFHHDMRHYLLGSKQDIHLFMDWFIKTTHSDKKFFLTELFILVWNHYLCSFIMLCTTGKVNESTRLVTSTGYNCLTFSCARNHPPIGLL